MDATRACGARVRNEDPNSAGASLVRDAIALAIASVIGLVTFAWAVDIETRNASTSPPRAHAAHLATHVVSPLPTRSAPPRPMRRLPALHVTPLPVGIQPARPLIESHAAVTAPSDAVLGTPIAEPNDAALVQGPPIVISDVRLVSLSPFSAAVSWQTSEAVASRVAYGFERPTLWTTTSTASNHTAVLSGLGYGKTYAATIVASSDDGRVSESAFSLSTPAISGTIAASIKDGALLVDGEPLFPTMVWGQCSDGYGESLAVGIDLFMQSPCESTSERASFLGGRAVVLADSFEGAVTGANVIGSFLPDEWDTFLPGDLTVADAQALVPAGALSPRFLTLTNHFFSGAAPLPQGKAFYPALMEVADVVGFDLYPLQNWCRRSALGDVFDAQRELVALAKGKPTYQWIEARQMDCADPTLEVTPQTLRAETWLAIAGGAHGIGYFPFDWHPNVGQEIARERREIDALSPALVEPAVPVTSTNADVRVGIREHNDAIYVIVVNPTDAPATTSIGMSRLGDRSLTTLDGSRTVAATSGSLSDELGPLDVHIYVSPPQ